LDSYTVYLTCVLLVLLQVVSFDKDSWSAEYRSHDPQHRPTSDTPLLQVSDSDISDSCSPRQLHGHFNW
jgi:hypothetical protein